MADRRYVVIETPWGELTGYLDPGADDKMLAFTMAAGMLKGKVANWSTVDVDAAPSDPR